MLTILPLVSRREGATRKRKETREEHREEGELGAQRPLLAGGTGNAGEGEDGREELGGCGPWALLGGVGDMGAQRHEAE